MGLCGGKQEVMGYGTGTTGERCEGLCDYRGLCDLVQLKRSYGFTTRTAISGNVGILSSFQGTDVSRLGSERVLVWTVRPCSELCPVPSEMTRWVTDRPNEPSCGAHLSSPR